MYSIQCIVPVFKDFGASKLISFTYNQSINFISISCFQFIFLLFYVLNFACILLYLKYDIALCKRTTENNQNILIEALLEDRPLEHLLHMSKRITSLQNLLKQSKEQHYCF